MAEGTTPAIRKLEDELENQTDKLKALQEQYRPIFEAEAFAINEADAARKSIAAQEEYVGELFRAVQVLEKDYRDRISKKTEPKPYQQDLKPGKTYYTGGGRTEWVGEQPEGI